MLFRSDLNGTTYYDRTNYFETVPTPALEQALFMESDRMGYMLGAISQETLDLQRGVVQNEKRQGDNQPYGLVGEAIPLEARIVAIADVFDALTSVRPYKKAWTAQDAMALIESEAGQHFDPQLVALFVGLMDELLAISQRWAD